MGCIGKQSQTQNALNISWRIACTTLLLTSIVACSLSKQNVRPDWIVNKPGNSAIGSASYAIFGESKARENAVMKALTELALQKGGVVDIKSNVSSTQIVNLSDGHETYNEHSMVKTEAIVQGQKIQVSANIKEYWKDTDSWKVWVLVVDE